MLFRSLHARKRQDNEKPSLPIHSQSVLLKIVLPKSEGAGRCRRRCKYLTTLGVHGLRAIEEMRSKQVLAQPIVVSKSKVNKSWSFLVNIGGVINKEVSSMNVILLNI